MQTIKLKRKKLREGQKADNDTYQDLFLLPCLVCQWKCLKKKRERLTKGKHNANNQTYTKKRCSVGYPKWLFGQLSA